jgi:hypothetical protein
MSASLQAQLTHLQQQLVEHAQQSTSRHEALQQQLAQGASDRSELKQQLGKLAQLLTAAQPELDTSDDLDSVNTCVKGYNSSQSGASKRAHLADDSVSPLDKDVILDTVFSYVGIKDYIYAAGVSRHWRVRYLKLCYSAAAANLSKRS